MNPQHSSPSQVDLRWRDGLQERLCTNYSLLHVQAISENILVHSSLSSIGFLSRSRTPLLIGGQTDVAASLYPTSIAPGTKPEGSFSVGSNTDSLSLFTAIDKQQIFNRMNGSPGDPPGTHMHKFKPKRITPFIHRLVSDPTSMEAGRETIT